MKKTTTAEPVASLPCPGWLRQPTILSLLEGIILRPTSEHVKVVEVLELVQLDRWIGVHPTGPGRPRQNRRVLARAFLAKCVLQCTSTELLRRRLEADEGLRASIGMQAKVPSAATFSRAFAEFAAQGLGNLAHEALTLKEYGHVTVWHVARDATAIPTQEQPLRRPKAPKVKGRPGRKKGIPPRPKLETRQERQLRQSPQEAISELPSACSSGNKLDSHGFPHWWNGYKLHADVAESGFPLAVVLSSASVHDSQVAIPLMKTTALRTQAVFYQLMDAAYVGKPIVEAASNLGQIPIVVPKATQSRAPIPLPPDRQARLKKRSAVERFFAQLKNNAVMKSTRYKGHAKVSLHVMFAILALCATLVLNNP